MPAIVAILLILGLGYQLFFRYEHWVDRHHSEITYERDNLTGETRVVREGDRPAFFARLFGSGRSISLESDRLSENAASPLALSMIEERRDTPEPLPLRKFLKLATPNLNADGSLARAPLPPAPSTRRESISPPEPVNNLMIASSESASLPATSSVAPVPVVNVRSRSLDINHDGQIEQIMYDRTANDGLMDISILVEHREVFYGRGKALRVLPSQRGGWSDIALELDGAETRVFRYNPVSSMYEARS